MERLLPWLLAAASGLALALALPGAGWTLLVLAFPGLLLEALERGGGRWRPWLLGWFAGVVHWAVATNWVMPVMHHYGGLPVVVAVLCVLLMAGLLGLCWAVACGLTALVPSTLRVWLLPAAWIALDGGRQFWPYRFPWNPPAAAFADSPWLLSSLPVWGATGLGWAALAVGAGLWALIRRPTRRIGVTAVAVAIALTLLLGALAPPASDEGSAIQVAVIQPGTSLDEKWDPSQWSEVQKRVWQLTALAVEDGAELVLWPESALPFRVESDAAYREMLVGMAGELGITVVLNSVGGSSEEGYTNSAYVVRPDGIAEQRYDKLRLVPFGETVPWWARLAFTKSLVREVGSFTPGEEPVVLDAGLPIGMAICYEVIFAELIAAEVRSGAVLLTTLTNDGWYGYSWAPHQHFAQVVLRAVENRRWFVRAALTGISGFVDPSGRRVSWLEVGETGYLVLDVQPGERLTQRSRWGDWWCAVAAAAALAMIVRRGKKTT